MNISINQSVYRVWEEYNGVTLSHLHSWPISRNPSSTNYKQYIERATLSTAGIHYGL